VQAVACRHAGPGKSHRAHRVRISVAQEPMATPRAHQVPPRKAVATATHHASMNARVEIGRNGGLNAQLSTHQVFRAANQNHRFHVRAANDTGPPAATRPGHLLPHKYVFRSRMIPRLSIQITRSALLRRIVSRHSHWTALPNDGR